MCTGGDGAREGSGARESGGGAVGSGGAREGGGAQQGGGRRAVPAYPAGFPVTLEGIISRLETCLKNSALFNFSSSSLSPLGKFKRILVNRQRKKEPERKARYYLLKTKIANA